MFWLSISGDAVHTFLTYLLIRFHSTTPLVIGTPVPKWPLAAPVRPPILKERDCFEVSSLSAHCG